MSSENNKAIIDYYECTAHGAYERWGGPTRAIHFGYYPDPVVVSSINDPNTLLNLHYDSLDRMSQFIISQSNIKPGQVVIDAGCGWGSLTHALAQKGAKTLGVNIALGQLRDISRSQLARNDNEHYVGADFGRLPILDSSIDRVIFLETLVHSQDKLSVLRDVYRVLKPGGLVTIADYFIDTSKLLNTENALDLSPGAVSRYIHIINAGWALKLDSVAGFSRKVEKAKFGQVESLDITDNILPSIALAARSAQEHLDSQDQSTREVYLHRLATVHFYELMKLGTLKYLVITAKKNDVNR